MRRTVEDALRKLARHNGENGTCWDAQSNLDRLNEVRELIYERGDYEGTTEWGCVRIDDCQCIYLPGSLETVRKAWISSMPLLVRNQHYMSLDTVQRTLCCSCAPDTRRALQSTGVRRPVTMIPADPFSLMLAFEDDADEGTEVIVTAKTYDGTREIFKISADDEEATYGERLKDIIQVVKPVTAGRVMLRAVTADGTVSTMAEYQPWQVNPRFTQMRVTNYLKGDCDIDLVVFAKKSFYNLTGYDELVDIESLSALKFGYQALTAQDGGRDQEYTSKLVLMTDSLNRSDANLGVQEGTVEINPRRAQSMHPRYDCGSRV